MQKLSYEKVVAFTTLILILLMMCACRPKQIEDTVPTPTAITPIHTAAPTDIPTATPTPVVEIQDNSEEDDDNSLTNNVLTNANSDKSFDKYTMRDITTMEIVYEMGMGINLGNTLEACGSWINKSNISNYEKAWGSPIITEEMIAGYALAGFDSLRIPVAWSNMMADDYTILPELLDRVETIVNWTLDNGMTAMINEHWDDGWWQNLPNDYDECMKKFTSIWEQVSERFKDYGDRLIFESMNEVGFDSVWNQYGGVTSSKETAFNYVNEMNQAFVDIVRASGGNNAKRHLVIEGYYTNIKHTCDPLFKMPVDPANRLAVTVHYYDPPQFAILEADADWGKAITTWGTENDYKILNKDMDQMKINFIDKGIPVILGEFAACGNNKTVEMKRLYAVSVYEAAYSRGMCPMLWDTAGDQYDRIACEFRDPLFVQEVMDIKDRVAR